MWDRFSRKEKPARDLRVPVPDGPDSIWPCRVDFVITEGSVRGFGELPDAANLVCCKGAERRQNWRSSVYIG